MKFIISGVNGYIGSKVAACLSRKGYEVIGLCRNISNENNENSRVRMITNKAFLENPAAYLLDDVVFIHLAFARANKPSCEIADSIEYTRQLLCAVKDSRRLKRFVYVSSQSVYGKMSRIRSVELEPQPETIYAMAKFAAEELVKQAFENETNYCILRLDNVIQSQNLVKALSKSAIKNGCISIKGGKQRFSYIDGDDAAEAITLCALKPNTLDALLYNVGPNEMRVTLLEIAYILKRIAEQQGNSVEIAFEPDDTELWAGMDSSKFCVEFGWSPKYGIEKMIERIYTNENQAVGGGKNP